MSVLKAQRSVFTSVLMAQRPVYTSFFKSKTPVYNICLKSNICLKGTATYIISVFKAQLST